MAQNKKLAQEQRKKLEREIASKLPNLSDEQLKKMAGGLQLGGYGLAKRPPNGPEIQMDDTY